MKYLKKLPIFLFGISILVFLGIVIYDYVFQSSVESNNGQLCEVSGGVYQDNICTCGSLFPTYNAETGTCQNINGESPKSLQEYHALVNRVHFSERCTSQGYDIYVIPGKALTFCYDSKVANPKMSNDESLPQASIVEMLDLKLRPVARITYLATDPGIWGTDLLSWCEDCQEHSQDSMSLTQQLNELGLVLTEDETSLRPFYMVNMDKNEGIFIPFIDEKHHVYIDQCTNDAVCRTIREHIMSDPLLLEKYSI